MLSRVLKTSCLVASLPAGVLFIGLQACSSASGSNQVDAGVGSSNPSGGSSGGDTGGSSGSSSGSSSGGPSGGIGTGSLNGTVGSTTFAVTSVIAGSADTGGPNLQIDLSNRVLDCCSLYGPPSVDFASRDQLTLRVFDDTTQVSARTYQVGASTTGAVAFLDTGDASCSYQTIDATGGTVTLSTLTASHVSGTYSVTFSSLGTFTGTFDAPLCMSTCLSGFSGTDAASTTCMP